MGTDACAHNNERAGADDFQLREEEKTGAKRKKMCVDLLQLYSISGGRDLRRCHSIRFNHRFDIKFTRFVG